MHKVLVTTYTYHVGMTSGSATALHTLIIEFETKQAAQNAVAIINSHYSSNVVQKAILIT